MPSLAALPFAQRLEVARRLLASRAAVPAAVAEVAREAAADARTMVDRIGAWARWGKARPTPQAAAYVLAALLGCPEWCPHLFPHGPVLGPWVARLALGRVDCLRCLHATATMRPPGDAADACDLCGRLRVTTFRPLAAQYGATVVLGDVCEGCWAALAGGPCP